MPAEVVPDKLSVPGPVVFGVGCRMNADEAAAALNQLLECRLFAGVEDISGSAEKNHRLVSRQIFIIEDRGVFGGVNAKIVLFAQRSNGGNARGNRVVPVSRGLGENQDRER